MGCTEPIAVGDIIQVQGKTKSGINLDKGTSKRCEIRVLKDFNNDGIIHIPQTEDK